MTVYEIFHYIVLHIKLVSCSQIHKTVKNKSICIRRNIAGKLHVFFALYFIYHYKFNISVASCSFSAQQVRIYWSESKSKRVKTKTFTYNFAF